MVPAARMLGRTVAQKSASFSMPSLSSTMKSWPSSEPWAVSSAWPFFTPSPIEVRFCGVMPPMAFLALMRWPGHILQGVDDVRVVVRLDAVAGEPHDPQLDRLSAAASTKRRPAFLAASSLVLPAGASMLPDASITTTWSRTSLEYWTTPSLVSEARSAQAHQQRIVAVRRP